MNILKAIKAEKQRLERAIELQKRGLKLVDNKTNKKVGV